MYNKYIDNPVIIATVLWCNNVTWPTQGLSQGGFRWCNNATLPVIRERVNYCRCSTDTMQHCQLFLLQNPKHLLKNPIIFVNECIELNETIIIIE